MYVKGISTELFFFVFFFFWGGGGGMGQGRKREVWSPRRGRCMGTYAWMGGTT